jgi:hypothetical protein
VSHDQQIFRWGYIFVFVFAFIMYYFVFDYNWKTSEAIDRQDQGRVQLCLALQQVFLMMGFLGTIIALVLKIVVHRIQALESELAKFVENDADPKAAAQTLADYLRKVRPSKQMPSPGNGG